MRPPQILRHPLDRAERVEVFEAQRAYLLGIAYRILGSRTDAEDVVQDAFIKWLEAAPETVETPKAWLATVVTRRAIDCLRSSHRKRTDYVGQWLPEPALTDAQNTPEDIFELSSTLSTAFLLLLERLSPKERAAYLLREIFDMSYDDVAGTLDVRPDACRKLVSRAKSRLSGRESCYRPSPERQEALLSAFTDAIRSGAPGELAHLLAEDVLLRADGGGKATAVVELIEGGDVARFAAEKLSSWWADTALHVVELNGALGLIATRQDVVIAAVTFNFDRSGNAHDIQIMRNPDKLAALQLPQIH